MGVWTFANKCQVLTVVNNSNMLMIIHIATMLMNVHTNMPTPIISPKDFGALLRDARRSRGWTQEQLAQRIGASRYWIAQFERGKPRAEIGLVLKALRALGFRLTAEAISSSPVETGHAADLERLLKSASEFPSYWQRSTNIVPNPSKWDDGVIPQPPQKTPRRRRKPKQ